MYGCDSLALVSAGLLPALDSGLLARAGARWSVAELRPGDRPMARLAKTLVKDTSWGQAYAAAESGGGARTLFAPWNVPLA